MKHSGIRRMHRFLWLMTPLLLLAPVAQGQVFDEQFEHWPIDLKINGRIVVAEHLDSLDILTQLFPKEPRHLTLIVDEQTSQDFVRDVRTAFRISPPKPNETPDTSAEEPASESQDVPAADTNRLSKQDVDADASAVDQVSVYKFGDANIAEVAATSEVLILQGAHPLTAAELDDQGAVLHQFVDEGGTLVVMGTVAESVGAWFSSDQFANPAETKGLNILPDCVVETGFDATQYAQSRLLSLLAARPRSVGIGLADNTALVLSGRKIWVAGSGSATLMLMANDHQPVRLQTIREPESGRGYSASSLIDLTEWRRDAIDRTLPAFPPPSPPVPFVENGTLVIVGGGGMPQGLMSRIVDLAGGPDEAKMVYIPCTEDDEVAGVQSTVESWKRMGVKHATFIHTKDRTKANTDEEFLAPLKDATGLWFGGGRQWNFADSYYGTRAHELMKDVLRRGGVIGGSSAGASIQARYLARATPIGNFDIMAPGYERGGLGFIGGVAIDQHFSQRGRQKDMTQLVNRYPQMLGIGIDEATAIVVQKSVAEVIGRGSVHFYDRRLPVYPDRPDYIALPAGSSYDLAARKVIIDTTVAEEPDSAAGSDDETDTSSTER